MICKYRQVLAWILYSQLTRLYFLSWNAHIKSNVNYSSSQILNFQKISKFINRNLESIWLNCTKTWETMSVSMYCILPACVMFNRKLMYKRTFEYAPKLHVHINLQVKMKPFYAIGYMCVNCMCGIYSVHIPKWDCCSKFLFVKMIFHEISLQLFVSAY